MRDWLPTILLILAVITVFWRVCGHEFTDWDDDLNVTHNPYLFGQTLTGLLRFWRHPYQSEYIPLSYTAWWVLSKVARVETADASGVGLNPYVFHTANLLLHIAACLVAYQLIRVLTARVWTAWAGALLFAIHPLQVEAVAWVTGLKDLLSGLLSLVALLQYVQFARADSAARVENPGGASPNSSKSQRGLHYVTATVALVAAVLAKPSAVAVPVMALAIDLWILRRPIRRVAVSIFPWLAIAGAFTIVGLLSQPGKHSGITATPIAMRPLVAGDTLAFYIGKVLLPLGLSPIYPHSIRQVLSSGTVWIAWLVPAALIAAAWAARHRALWLAAGVAILLAAPLPVVGLVPFDYSVISTVADRYIYLGLLGPALVLAFALGTSCVQAPTGRRLATAACGAGFLTLGFLSYFQTASWRDSAALFTRALEVCPSSDVAYCNLASDALSRGQLREALDDANHATAIDPNRPQNQIALGIILQQLGRHPEAGVAFLKAMQADPTNIQAITNLAAELSMTGHADKAIVLARQALKWWPNSPYSHRCMSMLLSQQHQEAAALSEAEIAVRLDPTDASAHMELGQILNRLGRNEEAVQQYAIAQAISPNIALPNAGSTTPAR